MDELEVVVNGGESREAMRMGLDERVPMGRLRATNDCDYSTSGEQR